MTQGFLKHVPALLLLVALGSNAFAQHRAAATGAPEIDPSIAAAGLTLLAGGTILLTGRRRDAAE
jgi:LPXTG-motif cell wall-anchored protein